MSIKIFTAWRVPLDRFTEATDWLHDHMWDKAKNYYATLIDALALKDPDVDEGKDMIRRVFAMDKLITPIDSRGRRGERGISFNCGFSFWILDNYVYIIPYGVYGLQPTEGDLPEWFDDYHYQDQVDRDENVTEEDHEARRETWEKINLGTGRLDWFPRMYVHSIVETGDENYYGMTHEAVDLFGRNKKEEE
jgi:hypothetical protein